MASLLTGGGLPSVTLCHAAFSLAKNCLVVGFAELFAGIEVFFVLLLGHVEAATGSLDRVLWVLERLVFILSSFAEAFARLNVTGLRSRVCRREAQRLPKLEIHVGGAV